MFPFYTPWKRQKTLGFLTFSGGIERKHWPEMDKEAFQNFSWKKIILGYPTTLFEKSCHINTHYLWNKWRSHKCNLKNPKILFHNFYRVVHTLGSLPSAKCFGFLKNIVSVSTWKIKYNPFGNSMEL